MDAQQEGRGEWRAEAARLLRRLTRRFGPLEPAVRQRVESADAGQLIEWGERLLRAGSLEDVLGDPS